MMQNGLGESYWDAQGVEIEACAILAHFRRHSKIFDGLQIFECTSLFSKIGCSGLAKSIFKRRLLIGSIFARRLEVEESQKAVWF